MGDDWASWLHLTCRCCWRGKRLWAANLVVVTPPDESGDWLLFTCGECGPQRLRLADTNAVFRGQVYARTRLRHRQEVRPGLPGLMTVEDLADLELDLWELLTGRTSAPDV